MGADSQNLTQRNPVKKTKPKKPKSKQKRPSYTLATSPISSFLGCLPLFMTSAAAGVWCVGGRVRPALSKESIRVFFVCLFFCFGFSFLGLSEVWHLPAAARHSCPLVHTFCLSLAGCGSWVSPGTAELLLLPLLLWNSLALWLVWAL